VKSAQGREKNQKRLKKEKTAEFFYQIDSKAEFAKLYGVLCAVDSSAVVAGDKTAVQCSRVGHSTAI